MSEDIEQIKEDLKFIKDEIRYASFDTIYFFLGLNYWDNSQPYSI